MFIWYKKLCFIIIPNGIFPLADCSIIDWELFGFLTFVCVCDDVDWTEDETLSENDLPALLAIGLFTVTLLCAWLLSFVLSAVSLIDINSTFNMSFALKFKNKINIFFTKKFKNNNS